MEKTEDAYQDLQKEFEKYISCNESHMAPYPNQMIPGAEACLVCDHIDKEVSPRLKLAVLKPRGGETTIYYSYSSKCMGKLITKMFNLSSP